MVRREFSCGRAAPSPIGAIFVGGIEPMRKRTSSGKERGFLRHHSLGLASVAILILWMVLYSRSNPDTHLGSFFGNAIADWSGVVLIVFATKYLYECGSSESRQPSENLTRSVVLRTIRDHSLSIFLLIT